MKNISKEYPGVKALQDVSISFEQGEVHALVGENGAGKSTFIKSISGAIRPTSGTIEFEGRSYPYMEPAKAIEMGIAVVYQELIQFEAMSVADNIFMGVKEYQGLVLNDRAREKKAAELLAEFDCHVSPSARIRELSIANRQIVELTKAMVRNAKVIIMDEPTAAITVSEQESLFKLVDKLKANKVTVIYISHRLDELFRICDRVSILRDGQYVTTKDIKDTSKQELINILRNPGTDDQNLKLQDANRRAVYISDLLPYGVQYAPDFRRRAQGQRAYLFQRAGEEALFAKGRHGSGCCAHTGGQKVPGMLY